MNIKSPTHFTLSRRNLLTLLKCLDQGVGMPTIQRTVSPEVVLTIEAEEDEQHYASKDRQPTARGRMGVGPDDVPTLRVEKKDDDA